MALSPLPDHRLYYTVSEAALACRRPVGLVRRWIFRGQLDAVILAEEILVPAEALEDRIGRLDRRREMHARRTGTSTARSR